MITEKEKEEIVQAVFERFLLKIPEIMGNLMINHAVEHKLNKEFYEKYKEFKNHTDIVMSMVEKVEGENTFEKYENILEKAVPRIREAIKLKKGLNMSDVSKPDKTIDYGEL